MKLTREGAARLGRHESRGFPVGDFEFRSEDFDGCFQNGKDHVILTVEEAKRLHDCAMFFWDDYEGTKLFTYDDEQFLTEMKKRIEQAEKMT